MADNKTMRLNKVLRELNISLDRAVEHLSGKGHVGFQKKCLRQT